MNSPTLLESRPVALAPADAAKLQALSDWLVAQGLGTPDPIALHAGFCERVVELGIPLLRGLVAVRTLHPRVDAVSYTWHRAAAPSRQLLERSGTPEWLHSPFAYLLANQLEQWRRRLDDGAALEFEVLERLRAEGGTDYYARAIRFDIGPRTEPTGMISSWVTDRAGGFTDRDLAVLARLLPRYALVAKALLARQIATNVLDTYVGHDAGQRILAGEIKRGHLETVNAVIVYADLRDFTAVSDRTPNDKIAPMLDAYFEAMVAPVVANGGQVLKFMGDGCLMTFRLDVQPHAGVCTNALSAAAEMRNRARQLNAARRAAGEETMELDIALHLGDVLYGNVGAADRLDFTVVGPAVNEASRIELLCKRLGRNVLVSEAFARAATNCAHRLESVGRHELRGVREPQELFALRED
ncbi:MAG TPA: adenylate/guanylate cyclase domain-containing protein [Alphaproteobacteria bacterium]